MSVRWRRVVPAVPAIAMLMAACLGNDAASVVSTPLPAPTNAEQVSLLTFTESLAPAGAQERSRTLDTASVTVTWFTPETIDAVESYYDSLSDERGFVLIKAGETTTVVSWVFTDPGSFNGTLSASTLEDGSLVQVTTTR